MKYIKKAPIVQNNPMSDRFSVLADNRIVTTSKSFMGVPKGADIDRQGFAYENGTIRWNTDLNEFEVYNGISPGTGWEVMRTVRPAPITLQNLGNGDYFNVDFGPLQYSTNEYYSTLWLAIPQNIFVYIENVFQIPTVNYNLIQVADKVYIRFTEPPPTKPIRVLLGYDGYYPPFPAS
jgi:hypothetical protein